MSTLQHHRSVTWLAPGDIEKARYKLSSQNASPALRYSSPWPWALALAINSTIWLAAAWLIWTFA